MPKGVRGFQKGDQWNGNTKGRPASYREIFTKKIFEKHQDDIAEGIRVWFALVRAGEPWAMKIFLDKYLDAHSNMDVTIHDTNIEYAQGLLAKLPDALLEQLKDAMKEEKGNEE